MFTNNNYIIQLKAKVLQSNIEIANQTNTSLKKKKRYITIKLIKRKTNGTHSASSECLVCPFSNGTDQEQTNQDLC